MTGFGSADARLMGLALALGRRGLGLTWPNPSVGAVLVDPARNDAILATGTTEPGGRPHAERMAIAAADAAAPGSARAKTLYVSLEPCSHHGVTTPCADAIVAAGIGRVVSAIEDPDPRVAGRGHARLRAAGIAVLTGVRAAEARADHAGHIRRVRDGRPSVHVKVARTADGYSARRDGARLLVTGEAANARSHMARAHADAILVSAATVASDDPRLDVRLPGLDGRRPVRLVLDATLRTAPGSRVVRGATLQPTWILCGPDASPDREAVLADAGVVVVRGPADGAGRLDLPAAFRELGRRGLTRVLAEAGPGLGEALAGNDLLDTLVLLTASHELGEPGRAAIGPTLRSLLDTGRLRPVSRERAGPDTVEIFERTEPCSPVS